MLTRYSSVRSHRSRRRSAKRLYAAVVFGLVLIVLMDRPGLTTFDTKFDLFVNPGGFMRQALEPWNPQMNLGSLQNQASGYLFPIGPFFAVGDLLHIPPWIWQRLWSVLVLVAAFEGMRRLAQAWLGTGAVASLVAGLGYALSPRVLSTVGVLSGETLPGAVLPWTVLPLVLAARKRLPWGRAVVFSAATVPLMGGHNATEVLMVLPLPALVIVLAFRADRLRALLSWCALVIVVCLWWIGPLLVQGRHAPPFLDFIESSSVTTGGIGWLEALRGATHWVAYLPVGVSHWQVGWSFVYQPVLVVCTTIVAILGLGGIASRRMPDPLVLVVALLLGLTLVTLGHGGAAGSPLSGTFQSFLDQSGAPFRNVHKADPLVRLPLALGFALVAPFAVSRWVRNGLLVLGRRVARRWPGELTSRWVRPSLATQTGRLAGAAALLALAVSAVPVLTDGLRADDGWRELPNAWQDMSETLEALPPGSRVLVVPAATSVAQVWGRTVDEPVQALDGVSWASRSQLPLAPVGGIRLLDSVEKMLSKGQPSMGLAPLLRRVGVSHVLVRSDLAASPDEPSADRFRAALQASPGVSLSAQTQVVSGARPDYALFSVSDPGPLVTAGSVAASETLSGSSEDLIPLAATGALDPARALLGPGAIGRSIVVTDSPKLRERSYGRIHDATSEVLPSNPTWTAKRPRHDFMPVEGAKPVVANHPDVESISVSSSASSIQSLGPVRPDEQPWAAIDGVFQTHWATAPFVPAIGQWWNVRFTKPVTLKPLTLMFDPLGAKVARVRLSSDSGAVSVRVGEDGIAKVSPPPGATHELKITVVATRGSGDGSVLLSEVIGLPIEGSPRLSIAAPATPSTTISLTTDVGRRACVLTDQSPSCNPYDFRGPEEPRGMRREVTFANSGTWQLNGKAVATGGAAVDRLFEPWGKGLRATSSSVLASDPLVRASAAVDGDPTSAWFAGPGDLDPSLTLTWHSPRTISRIAILRGEVSGGDLATVRSVEVDDEEIPATGDGRFMTLDTPIQGRKLTLHFAPSDQSVSVSEVSVDALEDLIVKPDPDTVSGLPCGFGPKIQLGNTTINTRLSGTLRDIQSGADLSVVSCDGDVAVPAGATEISVSEVPGFATRDLVLRPSTAEAETAATPVLVREWGASQRSVDLGGRQTAVLRVAENINSGWTARLNGKVLKPIQVDGWAQGWIVPEGEARHVILTYGTTSLYRASIIVGLTLVALVFLVALFLLVAPAGRRVTQPKVGSALAGRPKPSTPRIAREHAAGLVIGALGVAFMGPVWAAAALIGYYWPRRFTKITWLALLVAGVAAASWRVVVGGPGGWILAPDLIGAVVVGVCVGLCLRTCVSQVSRRPSSARS